jgi:formylglycine-generating enzyme required for sulfatase activity
MEITRRRPLVFVFHARGDWETVRVLSERLTYNGVDVILSDEVSEAINVPESEPAQTESEAVQKIVREADTVVFCLSNEFNKLEAIHKLEWKPALDAALEKRQGDLYVVTLRLHECEIHAGLKKWQPINLYEAGGYEELMHALQLRAGKRGAALTPTEDWKTSFYKIEPEPEEFNEEPQAQTAAPRRTFPFWVLIVIAFAVTGALLLRSGPQHDLAAQTQTADSVQSLALRATQNVAARATEQARTAIAEAVATRESRIQTETHLTSIPIAKTATALQALITPTITYTVVALPTQVVDAGNILMALVPEGGFIMGRDDDSNASPAHVVKLPAYYIDIYEVTNASFQACVNAGACDPPAVSASQTREDYYADYGDYPVIHVDWFMAKAYCEWRGARLPTEAEWEKAARGTAGIIHPWGDETGCFFANHNNCVGDTSLVGKYAIGRSIYDIFNMAGNVMEWTSSLLMDYPYDSTDGREDPASPLPRVLRGGSWASAPADILTYTRLSLDPTTTRNDIGFRCVRDATP